MQFDVLLLVVVLEALEGADPPLLDELIVAGELPGDLLGCVPGREVVVVVHGAVANVLLFHEVLGEELDGEVGGVEVKFVDAADVEDVD